MSSPPKLHFLVDNYAVMFVNTYIYKKRFNSAIIFVNVKSNLTK